MNIKENFDIYFELIEDPRRETHILYRLNDILFLIVCGMIAGCKNLEIIIEFGEEKLNFFKKYTEFKRIPCLSTISNVINVISPERLELCLQGLFSSLFNITLDEKEISIDGKTIRSTATMEKYDKPLHIITALLVDHSLSLGQKVVESKSNEIPAVRELIEELNIENAIISADAMHCQKETAEKIIENKGDYVLQVKANQGNLYEEIYAMFDDKYMDIVDKDCEYEIFSTIEKSHGRIEKRTCYVLNGLEYFNKYLKEWKGLKKIFAVKREIEKDNEKTTEISCYISSKEASAEKLLSYTRKHWQVESFHWLLDVNYDEDNSRIRNAVSQVNMNIIRKYSISILKNYIENNEVKRKALSANMRKCMLNEQYLEEVLMYHNQTSHN